MEKKKLSYHWIVVVGLFVVYAATIGISTNCFYGLVPYIMEEGISASQAQTIPLVMTITGMLISLVLAKAIRKFGFVPLTVGGTVLLGVGLAMRSFSHSFPMMLIWAFLQGIGFCCVMGVPSSLVLANWFHENRGTATGIAAAGSAIGGFLFVQVSNMMLPHVGWRTMNLIHAVITVVLLLPVCLFILRETPEEKGLLPYGLTEEQAAAMEAEGESGGLIRGITLNKYIRTASFWWLAISLFLIMFSNMGVYSNVTLMMREDAGHTAAFAGLVYAIVVLSQAPGKVLIGWVHDKFGITIGNIYNLVLGAGFFICLFLAHSPVMAILCGFFMGMRNAMSSVLVPYQTALIVGRRDYAQIFAVVNIIAMLGSSFGPVFAGAVYDKTGSFNLALIIFAVMWVVLVFTSIFSVKTGEGYDEL